MESKCSGTNLLFWLVFALSKLTELSWQDIETIYIWENNNKNINNNDLYHLSLPFQASF